MLTMKVFVLLLAVTLVSAKCSGCKGLGELIDANTRFALDTYRHLAATGNNVFFSPYSLSVVLGMLYEGSGGNTRFQMASVTRFDHVKNLPAFFKKLITFINAKNNNYALLSANRVYASDKYTFLRKYMRMIRTQFLSDVVPSDFVFNAEGVRRKINRWVEQMTRNKIKELIPSGILTDRTVMVLVNALYFKGDWESKFKVKDTGDSPFYLTSGKSIVTKMMHQTGAFKVISRGQYNVLELPYKGGKLSMYIVLPHAVDGLAGVEKLMTNAELQTIHRLLNRRRKTKVFVALPKFKIDVKYTMNNYLTAMGMPDLFSDKFCDLSGMDGTQDLYVFKIFHQSFIEVNEEGSEATSATGAVVNVKSLMMFKANHPFMFYIRDNVCGSVLFMGKFLSPK